jgi:hypothetical protein
MLWVTKRLLAALFVLVTLVATPQSANDHSAASSEPLKPEQIDALVAPIALYPDTLLAVVLMASTYPLEVVQADRWLDENKNLKGDQLKAAADKQSWDDSVKSLVGTPSVLSMMSTKLDWTQKLGDAVLAQQPDVMDGVQRLRARAQANDKLKSAKEQTVTVQQEANKQVIAIALTDPETLYVPQYDPGTIYGDWPYSEYPPYYLGAPGYLAGAGIAFGAGYLLGRWASGGNFWGGGINWGDRNIISNRPMHAIAGASNNWRHNPAHRQGVRYGKANVQQRFGNNNIRSGSQQRLDFRGRSGQQVLSPGADRTNLGDRAASRPTTTDRRATNTPRANDRGTRAADRGARAGDRGSGQRRANAATRPSPRVSSPRRDTAFGNIQRGGAAHMQAQRGRASMGGGQRFAGGGFRGGGGRRSDAALKHDTVLLGRLNNNLGFYRFAYNGSNRAYVGVIAQEVQAVIPEAVVRGRDGYLRVFYDKLGLKFETYDQWVASGSVLPTTTRSVAGGQGQMPSPPATREPATH